MLARACLGRTAPAQAMQTSSAKRACGANKICKTGNFADHPLQAHCRDPLTAEQFAISLLLPSM
jgi:positive regulator of sigma E activity